jgi:multicomponent Na+:H+ antiporter subunit C
MTSPTLFGLAGAVLVGLGLFGVVTNSQLLRKILSFNLLGGGVFLVFGAVARRGAAATFYGDPIPQAMVITGIVVAFAATALAVALMLRLSQLSGRMASTHETSTEAQPGGAEG